MSVRRSTWRDAYDGQMSIWRWVRSPQGREYLQNGYAHDLKAFPPDRAEGGAQLCAGLYGAEEAKLLTADPVFVSAEMCDVIEAAMPSFQPEPLLATDLMFHTGFCWYERPFVVPDRFEEPLHLRGWSWCPMASHGDEGPRDVGVALTLYADLPIEMHGEQGTRSGPCHLTPWWFGMTFEGNEYDLEGYATGAEWWWRIVQTTLRLMQQRIAVQHRERPDRAARRDAARQGFDIGDARSILVVRLRRERNEAEHDTPTEEANYSHRFIVGGHWRNQWYPSGQVHRQIWISPYVKGPDDKPLVIKPRRAYTWDR